METTSSEILFVGSEIGLSDRLREQLQARDFTVATANQAGETLAKALAGHVDVLVKEIRPPGDSALNLLKELRAANPALPVILLDESASAENAIEATKLGAYGYLAAPFDLSELIELIVRAASDRRTPAPSLQIAEPDCAGRRLVGSSRIMRELYEQIGLAAEWPSTILIQGATGTGKELIARAIHEHSSRGRQRFVAVNCNALAESLLESELFGYEAGAFTGARARRVGWLEAADQGTLFLDEIGELTIATQIKLLRFLQERTIQRLGGRQEVQLNIRILAATNRNLERATESGQFRQDLLYRLSELTIKSPQLKEHAEDIPELVAHFIGKWQKQRELGPISMHEEALDFFATQSWPGNVRQLENAVRAAMCLANGRPINLGHVKQACGRNEMGNDSQPGPREPLTDLIEKARTGQLPKLRARVIEDAERPLLAKVLALCRGNKAKAARWLGITRKTLARKLGNLGINQPSTAIGTRGISKTRQAPLDHRTQGPGPPRLKPGL